MSKIAFDQHLLKEEGSVKIGHDYYAPGETLKAVDPETYEARYRQWLQERLREYWTAWTTVSPRTENLELFAKHMQYDGRIDTLGYHKAIRGE